jgi:hypothetical protein
MALNLGHTEALLRRVRDEYPKPEPKTSGPAGFDAASFARFLGVSASDVCRWEAGEREAGSFLQSALTKFLIALTGDRERAVRTVYGLDLAAFGHVPAERPRVEGEVHELAVEVTERMGEALSSLSRAMSPRSAGGVDIVASEVPEMMPSARRLYHALGELIAAAPEQPALPFAIGGRS